MVTSRQLHILDADGDEMTVTANRDHIRISTPAPYLELSREDVDSLVLFLTENRPTLPPETNDE